MHGHAASDSRAEASVTEPVLPSCPRAQHQAQTQGGSRATTGRASGRCGRQGLARAQKCDSDFPPGLRGPNSSSFSFLWKAQGAGNTGGSCKRQGGSRDGETGLGGAGLLRYDLRKASEKSLAGISLPFAFRATRAP